MARQILRYGHRIFTSGLRLARRAVILTRVDPIRTKKTSAPTENVRQMIDVCVSSFTTHKTSTNTKSHTRNRVTPSTRGLARGGGIRFKGVDRMDENHLPRVLSAVNMSPTLVIIYHKFISHYRFNVMGSSYHQSSFTTPPGAGVVRGR